MTQNTINLVAPPMEVPNVHKALIELGCKIKCHINYSDIQFPQGTTRTTIPGYIANDRFKITFPNGAVIYEQFNLMLGLTAKAC